MQNKNRALISFTLFFLTLFATLGVQAENCLWKVTSGKGTLYLQGSAHVLKPEHYPLDPAIEVAYSNSTALVLEADMSEMASPETQQIIMSKAMLTPPETLKTDLSEETYQKLATACQDAGVPVEAFQQSKPWFAAMSLALIKMQKAGLNPEHGLDQYFYNKAITDQKPVIGLETIDFQINLFDSLANLNPDDFISRTLLEIDMFDSELETLLSAWKSGDIEALDKLMSESFKDYPDLYKKFISERNKNWVKQLSKMLKEDQIAMVVVGAAHFGGEEGLLKLLEKKGFKLEQL